MKTFKQFQESIGAIRILPALFKVGKYATGAYALKKGADFLGGLGKDSKKEEPKIEKKPKYENPGDGSIPGRYKDESLKDYKKRRYDEYQKQIDAS